jgi:hypothetical protein
MEGLVDVESTIRNMIERYPSLYRSRAMALLSLFDSYHVEWHNGELISLEHDEAKSSYLPYPALTDVADPAGPDDVRDVLFKRRENAKAQFTHDNAYLLARQTFSSLPSTQAVSFEGNRFDDIPEDVTPDWLEAAKELARIILVHKFKPKDGVNKEYLERDQKWHDFSVERCKQFLERFQVITPCPLERAARMTALRREAEALGVEVVDKNGQSVAQGA